MSDHKQYKRTTQATFLKEIRGKKKKKNNSSSYPKVKYKHRVFKVNVKLKRNPS